MKIIQLALSSILIVLPVATSAQSVTQSTTNYEILTSQGIVLESNSHSLLIKEETLYTDCTRVPPERRDNCERKNE